MDLQRILSSKTVCNQQQLKANILCGVFRHIWETSVACRYCMLALNEIHLRKTKQLTACINGKQVAKILSGVGILPGASDLPQSLCSCSIAAAP